MSDQHQDFVDLALEMIAEDGRLLFLARFVKTGSLANPQQSVELMPLMGLQTIHKESENKLVRAGTKKILIAGGDVEITTDMRMRSYGDALSASQFTLGAWVGDSAVGSAKPVSDMSIVDKDAVEPGETLILHKVYAKA